MTFRHPGLEPGPHPSQRRDEQNGGSRIHESGMTIITDHATGRHARARCRPGSSDIMVDRVATAGFGVTVGSRQAGSQAQAIALPGLSCAIDIIQSRQRFASGAMTFTGGHAPQTPAGLPSRKQILDFIATSDQPAGKREIARAFGLSGQDKIALKALLKDMADEGLIDAAPGRAFHKSGGVPQGDGAARRRGRRQRQCLGACPSNGRPKRRRPSSGSSSAGGAARSGIGDRVLARTEEQGQGIIAHPMKKLAKSAELVLGVVRKEGERLLAVAGRQARAARAGDQRAQGRRARRPGAVRSRRAGRRGSRRGSTRCSATRSRRAASA